MLLKKLNISLAAGRVSLKKVFPPVKLERYLFFFLSYCAEIVSSENFLILKQPWMEQQFFRDMRLGTYFFQLQKRPWFILRKNDSFAGDNKNKAFFKIVFSKIKGVSSVNPNHTLSKIISERISSLNVSPRPNQFNMRNVIFREKKTAIIKDEKHGEEKRQMRSIFSLYSAQANFLFLFLNDFSASQTYRWGIKFNAHVCVLKIPSIAAGQFNYAA